MADKMNVMENNTVEVLDKTKVLVALRNKTDDSKIAVTSEDYPSYDKSSYAVDGIIIREVENDIDILYSLEEVEAVFGEGAEDIPETDKRRKGQPSSINGTEYDGEERTTIQLELHPEAQDDGCAICEAIKFGWLPSYGEMTLLYKHKDAFNNLAEKTGIALLSDVEYWTSTQFSDDYMWSVDFANNIAEFWRSKGSTMRVRPCKGGNVYKETINA